MNEPWWIYTERSDQPEILDDPSLSGHDLEGNLQDLARVNRLLGGYAILQKGLKELIGSRHPGELHLVDVGCGGGDNLIYMAKLARKQGWKIRFTGIDLNDSAVKFATEATAMFPEIQIRKLDVFSSNFKNIEADIFTLNLVLHHFDNQSIADLLSSMIHKASILINDLQRNRLAHLLFGLFASSFRFSYVSRHDGLLSIKKSFSRGDWKRLLANCRISEASVTWYWAFRYLVLIKSTSITNGSIKDPRRG